MPVPWAAGCRHYNTEYVKGLLPLQILCQHKKSHYPVFSAMTLVHRVSSYFRTFRITAFTGMAMLCNTGLELSFMRNSKHITGNKAETGFSLFMGRSTEWKPGLHFFIISDKILHQFQHPFSGLKMGNMSALGNYFHVYRA